MKQLIRTQAGFTIVENLIALAILLIVSFALLGALVLLKQLSSSTRIMTASEKQVSDIADSIRIGIDDYQIDFGRTVTSAQPYSKEQLKALLAIDNLPMAWDTNISVPKDQCQTCPGRYGFVIQPYQNYAGLFIITLRMTHRQWKVDYKDYEFVVSVK